MRKQIFIALAVSSALMMAACGKKQNMETTKAPETVQGTEMSTEAAGKAEAAAEDFRIGKVENNVYTNASLNLKLDGAAGGFEFADADQLKQLSSFTAGEINDTSVTKNLKEGKTYFDMMAYTDRGVKNVNVVIQDMGVMYGIVGDIKSVVEASKDLMKSQFENMGWADVSIEMGTLNFCGKDEVCLNISATVSGVPIQQKQVYLKSGSYEAIITGSDSTGGDPTELLNYFEKAE